MNPNRSKPIVGEELIAVTPKGRYRERTEERVTVTKVGRKYFTCSQYGEFHIESWTRAGQNVHVNFPIYLYRTEHDMRDEDEHTEIFNRLGSRFRYSSDWSKLSLDQLRRIDAILNTPQPTDPQSKQ